MRTPLLLASLALALAACHRDQRSAAPERPNTLVISDGADADVFFPPTTTNPTAAQVNSMIFEHLAEPGDVLSTIGDAGWHGQLASSWTWARDSMSIAFHIDPRARWHDGPPVRAADVHFTFDLYRDPHVGSDVAPLLANIDSVTTSDSLTAVFWFKHRSPEEFFDAAFQMKILPEHLLAAIPRTQLQTSDFVRHPVGSGPYRFVRWVPRQSVELAANPTYHGAAPHITRLIWSIAPDPDAALVRLLAGGADFVEFVRPPDFAQIAQHPELKVVRYPSMAYGYLLFNLHDPQHHARAHPVFGDRDLRRALTMAVDHEKLVRSVFDTLAEVAVGPLTPALPGYDSTFAEIPFAPDSARARLEALGWHVGPNDGVRVKNGTPLAFTIMVPSSSSVRGQLAVLLQQMFAAVGAHVEVEKLDFSTMTQRLATHQFDAAIDAFVSDGSASTIRQSWSVAAARAKEGDNYGGYASARFDALVDTAAMQMSPGSANAYYRRAYQALIDDAPAIWLYAPRTYAAMRKDIEPTGMRADEWWANLDRWTIHSASDSSAHDQVAAAPGER